MAYDRAAAVGYAATWWAKFHPRFPALADDCTSFISQVLLSGGLPMVVTSRRDRGWWYLGKGERWSYSWAVTHALRLFLDGSGRGQVVQAARNLLPGDLIFYDWNGDGGLDHVAVVVNYDAAGEPLVAAHTIPSWNRPWRMTDSKRYSSRLRYQFMHITD